MRRIGALGLCLPIAVVLSLGALPGMVAAQPAPKAIGRDTPSPVARGQASLLGQHDPNSVLTINVGLAVRHSDQLHELIQTASTPGTPSYGRYLTNAQYMANYAPTRGEVKAVKAWLASRGLDVTGVSPDNLLVHVRARTVDAERAFGVTINDYSVGRRKFHANDRNPSVPADLSVHWVSGLSSYDLFKPATTCTPKPVKCGYDGGDFRAAYNISGDGKGQTLGFTLWGRELPQSDFTGYAEGTGNPAITVGGAGDNGLNYIQVDGATTEKDTDNEVALDTEIAHGVAPGIHETYWLGHDNSNSTLEDVLNDAANSTISVISNSWGSQSSGCPVDSNMETSLEHGAATGKTFYFSTGDEGASAGCQYPAVSQYVVAVGGTSLQVGPGSVWASEEAIENGGGCSNSESRPSWQTGIGSPKVYPSSACTGRAEPDVSADSGIGTYLYFDGAATCCTGGTSLSTPIWSALSVIWNKHNAATGRPVIGFSAPLIYSLANDSTTYANDFHDIISGSNGFAAATGWDEATGWGSPNFNNLSNNQADIVYTGPTSASHGDTITLSASLYDHGTTNGLGGRTIAFAAAGESCNGTTDSSGKASCSVTVADAPGHYSVIAAFAGDAGYEAASTTNPFTVLHIPTTITYTGATSGDYDDPVTLSARLTDNSDSKGIPNEKLSFSLGAENCTAETDSSGNAECSVTPLDNPGPYMAGVSFGGDEPTYQSSSTTAPFTLNQEQSKVTYTGPLTSHYHDALTVSATLTDPDGGAAIENKQITFTLGVGDSCKATTDPEGHASCSLTPHQTGTQNIVASFAGDIDYVTSSDTRSFSITPEETTIAYTGPTVVLAGGSPATLTAKLVEDGANDNDGDGGSPGPVPAETVTLAIGTQTCTGTTDATGNVSCTIPSVSVPLGPELLGATFAGDAFYAAASDTRPAIVFVFPSRGAFTLGDNSVATALPFTTVAWWADDWSTENSLTGGFAPPSFKGFAATVALPTSTPPAPCAGPWTSRPGNSSSPPASVPSYMGVLVSSSLTQSGSTISGDTTKIVVVKTEPGYAPDPGHHGTGTIVATYCP
jgi:Pro-kumamolisin, activation domain